MVIRKYVDSDFDGVFKILKESFPEVDLEDYPLEVSSLQLDNSHVQYVAICDDQVVGYTLVRKSFDPIIRRVNYWIDYVCVDSSYRNRGVASGIFEEIEKDAKNDGVLYLQLTSSRFRKDARKLYLKLGFSIRESDIFRKVI